ncbi:MAG: ribosome-associated translation inhibitor RaiA [Flavobacteriaceae bacterium]
MNATIQSVNFNIDKDLKLFVENKLDTLEKYYDKVINAEVFLKVQKTSDKENKIIEVKLNVPGDDIVVKKTAKTFEEGVSLTVDSLKRNLRKHKEKQRGR